MPLDENEIEDRGSSTDPALDAQPETPVADATSSNATGETDDGDLLSVVRDAVKESREPEQAASPAEGEEDGQRPAGGTEDDYSDVPFNQHPRFKALVTEKNRYRREAQEASSDAQSFRNVRDFMDQNGLSADEAADLLIVGGLMKTNPAEAWRRIKPAIQQLLMAAGEVLPDDLNERVQRGELTAEAALEVSRARAGVQSMRAMQSFERDRAQRTQQRETVTAVKRAADAWQAERSRNDPNFDAKLVPLRKELIYLIATEGEPTTAEAARAQLDRAYRAIKGVPQAQQAKPVRPITPVRSGQVAGNQRPQAETMLDIVRANRRTA
jgi:hypothetical protein